jgi:hypothetical protein
MDPNVIINRVMRLARLDTTVFDEVRDDAQELVPAMIVLAVSALLAGLGAALYWTIVPSDFYEFEGVWVNTLILGAIFFAVMYVVSALVIYVVLAQMFKVSADLQSLLRTLGYGSIPFALSLLMFIPILWPVFALVPLALLFVMMIYAVQSATNADSNQVVMATAVGFTVMVLVLGIIALQADGSDAPIGAGVFTQLFDFS